ncbi:MAG: hypothetical protein MI862_27080 [Desulfobacterales bacterium]|nr:hypothetical protein [Desulfobacterales bacterium]
MYLVDPITFKTFLDKNNLFNGYAPKPSALPCIVEFNRADLLKAKVEVSSFDEFLAVVKFGKPVSQRPKNKYWIRGNEWANDENGQPIKRLTI